MVRGGGMFKTKRGGGRNFGRDTVLDQNGVAESKASHRKDDNDAREPSGLPAEPELARTRAERRELKKKQAAQKQAANKWPDKDDKDADLINTNHIKKRLTISDLGSRELTRKEREAKEKQEAKDRYWKLHLAGKTDEAKSDLARLAKIREEREAAQAKRNAEAEVKAAEAKIPSRPSSESFFHPSTMVGGGGKFKTKRGGGRNFGRDTVLDQNGGAESKARKDDNDAREPSGLPAEPELTRARAERRELKKKQAANKGPGRDDGDAALINPNHVNKPERLNISDLGSIELTRKERKKKEAKGRYWKLHLSGETDEAKADLARLAKIREEREAAQAKRKADSEAEEAKKKAAMNAKRV